MTPASTGSDPKESYFLYAPPTPPTLQPTFEHDLPAPTNAKRAKRSLSAPKWSTVQTVVWAALPLLFYLIALVLALVVLFGTSESYTFMSVTQKSGTGRLDYYVLSASVPRAYSR